MSESRLKTKIAAYQNQCFDSKGNYTGFQCPDHDDKCPIKNADGLEIDDAVEMLGANMEMDHKDTSRFSKTRTTYPEQIVLRCRACHTERHSNDASASRKKWKN